MRQPTASRRVSLSDIANIIGVTKSTVSRALADSPRISDSRKQQIREIARKLHYETSNCGRNPTKDKPGLVAILMTEPLNELFNDPTYANFVTGIMHRLNQSIYLPLLLEAITSDQQERVLRQVNARTFDAIIDISPFSNPSLIPRLAKLECPTILLGKFDLPSPSTAMSMVYSDDEKGSHLAAEYVYQSGRRNPLALLGPENNPASIDRLTGYRSVFTRQLSDTRILHIGWDVDSGFLGMMRLMSHEHSFDSVLCASDRLAIGAMKYLNYRHVKVPDDVAVIGFDDIPLASQIRPKLTTIRQPLIKEGEEAANMIFRFLTGEHVKPQILPMKLIQRESC